jgi:flagellar hook-length control protein FliK
MEHRLLQNGNAQGDFKLSLLRLLEQVKRYLSPQAFPVNKGTPPNSATANAFRTADPELRIKLMNDLVKQFDSALARVQMNQLASLPQDEPAKQIWQFELPLLHDKQVDLFQVRIKREANPSTEDPTVVWKLTLQMNLAPLGPMRVELRLQGKALASTIWSERRETYKRIESHLPRLQQGFEQAGLEVTELRAYQGKRVIQEHLPHQDHLLSEKA